jgi:hypothetical protein
MRRVGYRLVCLTLALAALAAVFGLFPGLAAAVGLDFWNVPAALDAIGQAAESDRRIDEEILATQMRMDRREEVTEDVVAGRLTLVEAAAWFRRLDADAAEAYRRGWRRVTEGGSDEERYCRQVLNYAELALRGRADAADVLAGLNRQLEEAPGPRRPPPPRLTRRTAPGRSHGRGASGSASG